MAARINRTYQLLASNLVPSLLRAHDSSGSELNKIQFDANDLQIYDIVFDQNTYLKTGNLRSSLYSVMYISKDKKSLLIAKRKTHILKKSKYPNSKIAATDNFYTSANLHMEYIGRMFKCWTSSVKVVIQDLLALIKTGGPWRWINFLRK